MNYTNNITTTNYTDCFNKLKQYIEQLNCLRARLPRRMSPIALAREAYELLPNRDRERRHGLESNYWNVGSASVFYISVLTYMYTNADSPDEYVAEKENNGAPFTVIVSQLSFRTWFRAPL